MPDTGKGVGLGAAQAKGGGGEVHGQDIGFGTNFVSVEPGPGLDVFIANTYLACVMASSEIPGITPLALYETNFRDLVVDALSGGLHKTSFTAQYRNERGTNSAWRIQVRFATGERRFTGADVGDVETSGGGGGESSSEVSHTTHRGATLDSHGQGVTAEDEDGTTSTSALSTSGSLQSTTRNHRYQFTAPIRAEGEVTCEQDAGVGESAANVLADVLSLGVMHRTANVIGGAVQGAAHRSIGGAAVAQGRGYQVGGFVNPAGAQPR
jgi:hypothetical protein